jgi:hypothetical protein
VFAAPQGLDPIKKALSEIDPHRATAVLHLSSPFISSAYIRCACQNCAAKQCNKSSNIFIAHSSAPIVFDAWSEQHFLLQKHLTTQVVKRPVEVHPATVHHFGSDARLRALEAQVAALAARMPPA